MKRALVLLFALAVVGGVAGLYLYVTPGRIVKTAIGQIGSALAETAVSVDHVEMTPETGAGVMRGLHIANPAGYGGGDVIRFDEVTLTFDAATVGADPVVIRSMVIDRPYIAFDHGDGGDNLAVISDTVASHAGENGGAAPGITPKLVIEELVLMNGIVRLGPAGGREADLPTIRISAIGTPGTGATPAEVALAVLQSLRTASEDAADK